LPKTMQALIIRLCIAFDGMKIVFGAFSILRIFP
jgi:hypothetical protein